MPRWLGRFSFSFFVVGFFLAWKGYEGATGALGSIAAYQIILFFVAAMLCAVMGFLGLRVRHGGR